MKLDELTPSSSAPHPHFTEEGREVPGDSVHTGSSRKPFSLKGRGEDRAWT